MENTDFESHWTSYATNSPSQKNRRSATRPLVAGGVLAAAGAALAIPDSASASIMYVPLNKPVYFSNSLNGKSAVTDIALPGGGVGLRFSGYFIKNTALLRATGSGQVGGAKAVAGRFLTNASQGVEKLGLGAGVAGNFANVSNIHTFNAPLHVQSGPKAFGTFPVNNKDYFAGFQITSTGANGYAGDLGYIELAVGTTNSNSTYPNELTLVGYAYNTTPGDAIVTAQLAVPEASNTSTALLLLACAGGSLATWRKSKKAVA